MNKKKRNNSADGAKKRSKEELKMLDWKKSSLHKYIDEVRIFEIIKLEEV